MSPVVLLDVVRICNEPMTLYGTPGGCRIVSHSVVIHLESQPHPNFRLPTLKAKITEDEAYYSTGR
jgi:hypothetical protein